MMVRLGDTMIIDDLLKQKHMTKYRLAAQTGISNATLSEICRGKTKLEKCSAETVYKLAKALGVSMELLTESGLRQTKCAKGGNQDDEQSKQ